MRRKLIVTLALTGIMALGVAAVASAVTTTIRAGNLIVTFGANVSPKAMPKNSYVPVTTTLFGTVKTSDGTHPSALREVVVDIDKDVKLNVKGLPTCSAGQLEAQNTAAARRVCGKTTVGTGIAHAEIAFQEQKPLKVTSPITVFNGGEKGGKIKLLIHTFITVPVPAAIVTDVTIQRRGTGVHSVARIPQIVGGNGSALDFKFKLQRNYQYKGKKTSYFEAKCPDGKFVGKATKILFKNETGVPNVAPQTVLKGSVVAPCTPKG